MRAHAGRPGTVDAYLKPLGPDRRAALQRLRATIRAAVPRGEECISYGLPCVRLDGRMLVAAELAAFETSKGTVRFTPKRPIPATLVRKIVKQLVARQRARVQRQAARQVRRKRAPR